MVWGLMVFRVALGIHFPVEDIKNRIGVELDKSTGSDMQIQIGELSLASMIGLKAQNTILFKKDGNDSIPIFVLDSIQVALSPIQTILGALGVSLDGELLGGTMTAYVSSDSFQPNENGFDLSLDATELGLDLLPLESDAFSANLQGLLTGHIEGSFPLELPHKNSEGRFAIAVDGLGISNAAAQGFELPDLQFSQASIEGIFNKGKIELTDANFVSESIGLELGGDILLSKQWQRSRLRLTLELTLGSEFSLIAKMIPQLKNNKLDEEDGNSIYKLNIIGTVKNPRIKTSTRTNPRRPSKVDRADRENNPEVNKDTPSPDERRKERRERIEARKKAQEERRKSGALDLPDNPRSDIVNRPLRRIPALEENADEGEFEEEEEDELEEQDEPSEEPSDDQEMDDDEPQDEDND
jgi:type II secretion system protein N